ncbi:hypothetical protein PRIPAC_74157 [Pristionchus pacificus]|uniref:Uncharacterized protein n=1 Tax=Pristionchus pacificus TaxID=54126 RepID=A0A2A6C7T8_PRIPA|nr:hypothetical protein PRIPAC_74157 [Pristionchus pacificus]|eukprot:PDM74166.1 hypothetical protein PRIPAC_41522 [Pristionchus pacificus]
MEYGLLSLLAPVWQQLVVDNSSSTTVPNNTTTADHHYTTSVRATPTTTFPDSTTTTTPPLLLAEARAGSAAAPAATYADKTVLLARAIEDGTADRTVFYVTLCLCLLQLLVVVGMRFTRYCACKSTQDGSAESLLNDDDIDVVKPATVEETKTLRTAREKSSRKR